MELLWLLVIILVIAGAIVAFRRSVPARRETVVRREPRRRSRVVERETVEPTADGGERRVVERDVPDERRL